MKMVESLNDENLGSFLKKNKIALVDFYAEWCAPCKAMAPIIEELSNEMKGKVAFGKIDVDKNEESRNKYGVMSVPTLIIFSSGKLVDRIVGLFPKEMIKKRLEKII
jgi:thioredoxin 1